MTPERAAELADKAVEYGNRLPNTLTWKVIVKQAILQACAEERETCAKIADKWEHYCHANSSSNDAALCKTISKDIRGGA